MIRIALAALGLFASLAGWRIYATIAGGRRAYRRLLAQIAPITQALGAGRDPTDADLVAFASDRRTRRVLYDVLDQQKKLHLFPIQYLTWEAMAEADLAAWLNHPNELGSTPDEMELMTRVRAPAAETDTTYFVFRYRMRPPHWAAKDGWLAGVAGPYDLSQEPRPDASGTFSRFESFDSRTPEQHVEMMHRGPRGQ